ncbi:IS1 family transposase [Acetivibrio sp. MSJd-27]|uniref:IS1 family transposase n=1 Tax=Acetivibrio sp. MSJd-27 TaxID=2841523 RepID=UPI0035ABC7C6
MQKIIPIKCPKCNNSKKLYQYGKTLDRYQKYQCRECSHQFAPNRLSDVLLCPLVKANIPLASMLSITNHDYELHTH